MTERVKTHYGEASYAYAERVSICMESGATLQEARRIAGEDERREKRRARQAQG